jgi:hypothetical protein
MMIEKKMIVKNITVGKIRSLFIQKIIIIRSLENKFF